MNEGLFCVGNVGKKSVGLNIVIYVEIVNFVKEFFLRLICLYGCYFWDLLIIVNDIVIFGNLIVNVIGYFKVMGLNYIVV